MGKARGRGQADPEGRRLREQEHPVLRCPASWRTWAARTAISRASRSAFCTPSGRRRARVARRVRSASASAAIARGISPGQGAAVSHAGRHQSGPAAGGARSVDHGDRRTSWAWGRWALAASLADRLQDTARSTGFPPAFSSRSPTIAGRSAASASCWMRETGAMTQLAVSRSRTVPSNGRCSSRTGFVLTGREIASRAAADARSRCAR